MTGNKFTPQQINEHPDWGLVTAVHVSNVAPNVTPQASTTPDVKYTITIYTDSGEQVYPEVSPAQARYDCWFYPAPLNAIAKVCWIGETMAFTVLELPVTEDC